MNTRQYQPVAKAAAESFTVGAGTASFVFDIFASFFKIPSFVKWIVAGVVGLIAGCFAGHGALETVREEEKREVQEEKMKENIVEITKEMKEELETLKREHEHEHTSTARMLIHMPSSKNNNPNEEEKLLSSTNIISDEFDEIVSLDIQSEEERPRKCVMR